MGTHPYPPHPSSPLPSSPNPKPEPPQTHIPPASSTPNFSSTFAFAFASSTFSFSSHSSTFFNRSACPIREQAYDRADTTALLFATMHQIGPLYGLLFVTAGNCGYSNKDVFPLKSIGYTCETRSGITTRNFAPCWDSVWCLYCGYKIISDLFIRLAKDFVSNDKVLNQSLPGKRGRRWCGPNGRRASDWRRCC